MQQFLELFNPLPGNKYLIATTHTDAIATALAEMLLHVNGTLSLECYPGEHEVLVGLHVKRHDIKHFKAPLRAPPREYDVVVLQDQLQHHAFPEKILQLCYTTLANAAHIIIMQQRGTIDFDKVMAQLEALEYRASNRIDLLDAYDLVMAKKLHMWGNGL